MIGYDHTQGEAIAVVAGRLDESVRAFEAHADQQVRQDVFVLLERVDTLHRTALARLIGALRVAGAGTALARATDDPAVRLLLELYNFLPGDDPASVELALDQVRPSLEALGLVVRLLGIDGSVVRLRLTGALAAGQGEHPSPRALIEDVLREHFPALARIEIEGGIPAPPANFIPLAAIGMPPPRPVLAWHATEPFATIMAGAMRPVVVSGAWLLLCNVAGEAYAVRNACPRGKLPLAGGKLVGTEIHCPWHGCRFDVRTGARTRGDGPSLEIVPVQVENGIVQVRLPVEVAMPSGDDQSG